MATQTLAAVAASLRSLRMRVPHTHTSRRGHTWYSGSPDPSSRAWNSMTCGDEGVGTHLHSFGDGSEAQGWTSVKPRLIHSACLFLPPLLQSQCLGGREQDFRHPSTPPALQPCHKKEDLGIHLQRSKNELPFLVRLLRTSEVTIVQGSRSGGYLTIAPPRDTQTCLYSTN